MPGVCSGIRASGAALIPPPEPEFGRRMVGSVYGWIFVAHLIGSSIGAAGGGMARVWLGGHAFARFHEAREIEVERTDQQGLRLPL